MEKGTNKANTDVSRMVELIGHLGDLKSRLRDVGDGFTKICIDLDGDVLEELHTGPEPTNEKIEKKEGIFWELHRLTLECNLATDRLYRIQASLKRII